MHVLSETFTNQKIKKYTYTESFSYCLRAQSPFEIILDSLNIILLHAKEAYLRGN